MSLAADGPTGLAEVCRQLLLQTEDVRHVIEPLGGLRDEPSSPQRPPSEIVPAMRPVTNFDPLSHASEEAGMLPHEIACADGMDADLRLWPLPHDPLPPVNADLFQRPPP